MSSLLWFLAILAAIPVALWLLKRTPAGGAGSGTLMKHVAVLPLSASQRIVTVDLKSPTVLLVNSNWNEHWKVDHGNVIKVAGQLAVDLAGLPPGRHTLHIRYAPRSFAIGAVLTALSLPLFGLLFFRARRRPKKESP